MKLVIQRVKHASVKVVSTGEISGSIKQGLCILWGISRDDMWEDAEYCIRKVLNAKLWEDLNSPEKAWGSSVKDNSFAMINTQSRDFFNRIINQLKKDYQPDKIQTGSFGNRMEVSIENDGPVTLVVDTATLQLKRLKQALPAS